ncbi:hypothetical protein JCM3765_000365 [Sporobolomyces pararoseus]
MTRSVEVVLSSTSSNSPLPLTSLHSLETGQTLFSFKSPPPPSTTTTSSSNSDKKAANEQQEATAGTGEQTMSWIPGGMNGVGGTLVGLGGKDGRALLNVWNLTRESTISRLIPPVRLTCLTTSPLGEYLVGGTQDGRIFLWEFSTGNLLSTLDGHYRSITCLSFTKNGSFLLSASQDAGISVWSLGRILNSTPLNPTTPFTSLSDHTLEITSLQTTTSSNRVFSSSKDGTVKIWDLSITTPSSLLSTFQFQNKVQHLTVDPLERFFFVSIPTTNTSEESTVQGGSKILRVNLYRKSSSSTQTTQGRVVSVGGTGSIGELERIDSNREEEEPGMSYTISEPITSIQLSNHSQNLIISTLKTCQIQILSLDSLLPIRIISPPPSSSPFGGIYFLTTFLYQLPTTTGGGTEGGGGGVQREVANSLGRSVISVQERERGGKNGRIIQSRVLETSSGSSSSNPGLLSVEELIQPVGGLNSLPNYDYHSSEGGGGLSSTLTSTTETVSGVGVGGDREIIERLEKELQGYRKGLERVKGVNERIWKSVVEGTIG